MRRTPGGILSSKPFQFFFSILISLSILAIVWIVISGTPPKHYEWVVIPSGVRGGIDDTDLSCYIIAGYNWKNSSFVALDAGNLLGGLILTQNLGHLYKFIPKDALEFFRNNIKAYLISHAHLDHLNGLAVGSADDAGGKKVIGIPSTINNIAEHLFNWELWPDMGPNGIGSYNYVQLENSSIVYDIPHTTYTVRAFILNHNYPYQSTAFLLYNKDQDKYLLYFGDTGPDSVEDNAKNIPMEDKNRIGKVWDFVTPLLVSKSLSAIFLECSYNSSRPDQTLFGHLTPKYVVEELKALDLQVKIAGGKDGVSNLNVIITHIKPSGVDAVTQIRHELNDLNDINVNFYYPNQGVPFFITTDSKIQDLN